MLVVSHRCGNIIYLLILHPPAAAAHSPGRRYPLTHIFAVAQFFGYDKW